MALEGGQATLLRGPSAPLLCAPPQDELVRWATVWQYSIYAMVTQQVRRPAVPPAELRTSLRGTPRPAARPSRRVHRRSRL